MAKKTVSHYMVFACYPKKGATVRATYSDGTTRTWKFGEPGFEAAYKKGMKGKRK